MKSLKDLIAWTEENPKNHLDVTDADSAQIINNDLNRDMAREKSGSVENWFADIAEKGHTNIIVSYRTKKGTGWSARKAPQLYKIGAKAPENTPERSGPVPGLAGAASASGSHGAGLQGLGFAESVNLSARSFMLDQANATIAELKQELKELKDENKELLDEERANKRKADSIKSGADILTAISPALNGFIEKLSGSKPGLNAPQPDLTPTKQAVFNLLQQPGTNDGMAEYAYHLIDLALQGKQEFINEFVKLVQKHTQNAA